jgi:hypothetical protein
MRKHDMLGMLGLAGGHLTLAAMNEIDDILQCSSLSAADCKANSIEVWIGWD